MLFKLNSLTEQKQKKYTDALKRSYSFLTLRIPSPSLSLNINNKNIYINISLFVCVFVRKQIEIKYPLGHRRRRQEAIPEI
jgi:hypothetical protein